MRRRRKLLIAAAIAIFALAFVVLVGPFLAAGPLRRSIERQVNARLEGYRTRIGAVSLWPPWNLALKLKRVVIVQEAHPDPPVAAIDEVGFDLQWSALFHGRIVGDMRLVRPRLFVNLPQLQTEMKSEKKLAERGWQEAVEAIYPLKINEFRVEDGSLTYIQAKRAKPLEMHDVSFVANDIRNVRSAAGVYPSPVALDARLFEEGRIHAEGHADFMAEPHAGVHVETRIEKLALDRLDPLTQDYQLRMKGGVLDVFGRLEYSPRTRRAQMREVALAGLNVTYLMTPAGAEQREEVKQEAKETAREVGNEPGLLLRVDRFRLDDARVEMVNTGSDPDYRLFISKTDFEVRNLSNHATEGAATFRGKGSFMGSGAMQASGAFRPDRGGADFDLDFKVENTDLTALNDLLRAYGKFDVKKGRFSLYTELAIKDGYVDGYIKPLFRDLDVYDRQQDREKNIFKKAYEGLVEGLGKLLRNEPRKEVATVTPLRGRVGDASASNWQVVVGLVKNAFFDAILPGFEQQASAVLKRGGTRDDERMARRKRDRDDRERTGGTR